MLPLEYIGDDKIVEDEWDEEYEFEDEDILDDAAPVKKKSGFVTIFILFLILLGGLGGGYYYISTPQGAALREKIPENILSMIPLMPIADRKQIANNVMEDDIEQQQLVNTPPSLEITEEITEEITNNFSAPPMPLIQEDKFDNISTKFADNTVPLIDMETTTKIDFLEEENSSSIQDTASETIEMVKEYQNDVTDLSSIVMEDISSKIKPEALIDVEDRLLSLEKAIYSIEKNMVQQSALVDIQSELKTLRQDMLLNRELPKSKKPAQIKHSKTKTKSKSKPKPIIKKIDWVLQSAQPGKATIVRKGKISGKNILVGDIVHGLGKIIAIEQDSITRYWIVRGTKGSIKQ